MKSHCSTLEQTKICRYLLYLLLGHIVELVSLTQLYLQGAQRSARAQVSADLEERKWIAPHHIGAALTYRSTPQGQYTQTLLQTIRHFFVVA